MVEAYLNRKYVVLAALLLTVLILASIFIGLNVLSKQIPTKPLNKPFYVGVEFAYADQFGELKALVDKVKDYTNLFVIGSVGMSFNRSALDQSADYLFNSGLNFIVLFTGSDMYNASIGYPADNNTFVWMKNAGQKYGDKFLGVYRYDEPGGSQLDDVRSRLIKNGTYYSSVNTEYNNILSLILKTYYENGSLQRIFTSDYGLYWFDYASNYTTVFGEFVGNQSRQDKERMIALDRGAAESFNKTWGVIVTWKYFYKPPYLESGDELYSDLSLAYNAGATYAVVFSYPNVTNSNYGTLTQSHFDALHKFWINIHSNPESFASYNAEVAYVIPKDYGFGFRNPNDSIWGLFPADELSPKIWNDTSNLLSRYETRVNIIYDEPAIIESTLNNYTQVYYWNQTIT